MSDPANLAPEILDQAIAEAWESRKYELVILPRLLDIEEGSAYMGIKPSTFRDWIQEKIIKPVPVPGSRLRKAGGAVSTFARDHQLRKILVDRLDLDALIEKWKTGAA